MDLDLLSAEVYQEGTYEGQNAHQQETRRVTQLYGGWVAEDLSGNADAIPPTTPNPRRSSRKNTSSKVSSEETGLRQRGRPRLHGNDKSAADVCATFSLCSLTFLLHSLRSHLGEEPVYEYCNCCFRPQQEASPISSVHSPHALLSLLRSHGDISRIIELPLHLCLPKIDALEMDTVLTFRSAAGPRLGLLRGPIVSVKKQQSRNLIAA